jgi:hypothetical protein
MDPMTEIPDCLSTPKRVELYFDHFFTHESSTPFGVVDAHLYSSVSLGFTWGYSEVRSFQDRFDDHKIYLKS